MSAAVWNEAVVTVLPVLFLIALGKGLSAARVIRSGTVNDLKKLVVVAGGGRR